MLVKISVFSGHVALAERVDPSGDGLRVPLRFVMRSYLGEAMRKASKVIATSALAGSIMRVWTRSSRLAPYAKIARRK